MENQSLTEQYGSGRGNNGQFLPGNRAASNRGENKVSTKAREAIINFVENNVDKIQESFDKLKAKEKLDFIANIMSYAVPKLSSVQTQLEGELTHKIEITWNEPTDKLPDTNHQGSNGELQGIQSGLQDNS